MNSENKFDKYLIIVSKSLPLTKEKEDWLTENFEYVPYTDEDGQSFMEAETFKAYTALAQLMKKKHHIDIVSHSAGRTVAAQEKVYQDLAKTKDKEWMESHVANPGESEHHTGLAFDIKFKHVLVPEALSGKALTLASKLGLKKKIFQTIEKEAVQFGLVKRYHADKESVTGVKEEDWHFRYVGVENAKKMYESGMCLEEYVKELKLQNEQSKIKVH